uniref:peptidylprolyl isomerase n=1 Tax=Haptolina ericina TaxID=156174 RepID=A0A7S3FB38_9EUKA
MQVQKGYFVRLHYTIHIDDSSKVGTPGELIEESKDFTRGQTIRIGLDSAPVKAWDMVMLNMCLGQKISMVVPPEVGYKEPKAGVPEGATLFFEIEIMIIMEANKQTGKPMPPNLFKLMDSDGSRDLDEREIHYHFDRIGQKLPSPTLFKDQDKDSDGKISWDEFSGPKGTKDEL